MKVFLSLVSVLFSSISAQATKLDCHQLSKFAVESLAKINSGALTRVHSIKLKSKSGSFMGSIYVFDVNAKLASGAYDLYRVTAVDSNPYPGQKQNGCLIQNIALLHLDI